MAAVHLSEEAALMMMLHASKHPSCTVNGVLLGKRQQGGSSSWHISLAIPLFHRSHVMAPCMEMGLAQVRQRGARAMPGVLQSSGGLSRREGSHQWRRQRLLQRAA